MSKEIFNIINDMSEWLPFLTCVKFEIKNW